MKFSFYFIQFFVFTYILCPRSSDPFDIVTHYIKWITTSWTYSRQKIRPCILRACYVLVIVSIAVIFTEENVHVIEAVGRHGAMEPYYPSTGFTIIFIIGMVRNCDNSIVYRLI